MTNIISRAAKIDDLHSKPKPNLVQMIIDRDTEIRLLRQALVRYGDRRRKGITSITARGRQYLWAVYGRIEN
jgi:hypothetical protein